MLFNSFEYIIFLPVAALVLFSIPGKFQWLWLLACSIFFYYTLLPWYLVLFLGLILLNFFLGKAIERSEKRRNLVFAIAVCINIIILAIFKYSGVLGQLLNGINKLSAKDHPLLLILPAGLSFFVFTILAYLIEIKRGNISSERHLGVFAASMMFFPKMLQGPIERPGNILPEFRTVRSFSYDKVADGLKQILWGYFKKLVIADRLALYVNAVYDNHDLHGGKSLLIATIFYSFQIYADFSGYTDIALGSAKVLGFDLTNNFKRPYFATSVREFWNRWHISFSSWLRDYLFLPLAFFFTGKMGRPEYLGISAEKWIFLLASMITFAICGIWHGEGLNFLIWGLLFGFYLTVANWSLGITKKARRALSISKKSIVYKIYGILVTFALVTFAWIFFRAGNFTDATEIIHKITSLSGNFYIGEAQQFIYCLLGIILLTAIEFHDEFIGQFKLSAGPYGWILSQLAYVALILIVLLLGVFDGGQFIYFQF